MYEVKLNIEEKYLSAFLAYIHKFSSATVEKVTKQDTPKVPQETAVPSKTAVFLSSLAPNDPLREVIKPINNNITLEEIIKKQNYKGTNWTLISQIAEDMAIEEPIEDLLAQLAK